MTTVDEAVAAAGPMAAANQAGVNTLSGDQAITFTQYVRRVLPLDGYVFWIRSDLATGTLVQVTAKGSLHYATANRQDENESFAVNRVVFTAQQEIQDLNAVGSNTLFIGTIDSIRFAFSERKSFYRQAGLWHYTGDAVYPTMETQLVDDVNQLINRELVVSNSLPAWLSINGTVTAYPSFLIPDNTEPPYASIHIDPGGSEALQSIPRIDSTASHWQLVSDRVRVTLYGLRNDQAMNYLDEVIAYITDNDDVMGLMNAPVVRDDKKAQSEISALGIKKIVEFKVSYYQSTIRTVARKLILHCIPTLTVSNTP